MDNDATDELRSDAATEASAACLDCDEELPACLARLGALRCHDCRAALYPPTY
jgi:hypothetical protein